VHTDDLQDLGRDDPHAANPRADIVELLRSRWSTRLFDPVHELFDDELTRIMEAARWAPSAGNSQPWAFIVGRRDDPTHRRFVELLSRGNTSWAPDASALVLTLHQSAVERDSDLTLSDYAMYDLGQAAAHLSIQAQSMGLFVHQFAGFDHERAAQVFEIPNHWTVTTGIAIGRRADPEQVAEAPESLRERERTPRRRNEFAGFVFAERFGNPAGLLGSE
jgi:nitroreductase